MKIWSWFKQLHSKSNGEFVDNFPSKLKTDSRGIITAQFTELRGNGRLLSRSCRYESNPTDGRVNVRFTPNEDAPANPELWKQVFEERLGEFEHGWQLILAQNTPRLEPTLKPWLQSDLSVQDLIVKLKPGVIAIEADGTVRLAFESSPMLQHHDLTIEFGSDNRIKDVSIEG